MTHPHGGGRLVTCVGDVCQDQAVDHCPSSMVAPSRDDQATRRNAELVNTMLDAAIDTLAASGS